MVRIFFALVLVLGCASPQMSGHPLGWASSKSKWTSRRSDLTEREYFKNLTVRRALVAGSGRPCAGRVSSLQTAP